MKPGKFRKNNPENFMVNIAMSLPQTKLAINKGNFIKPIRRNRHEKKKKNPVN